jgi:hypothetical protein
MAVKLTLFAVKGPSDYPHADISRTSRAASEYTMLSWTQKGARL